MNRRRFVQSSVAAAVAAAMPMSRSYAAILGASTTVDADINAITGDGAEVTLKRGMVQELADSMRGDLLLPGHEAYEEARRVLNATIDKHPALIVQPRGSADVKYAVDFACPACHQYVCYATNKTGNRCACGREWTVEIKATGVYPSKQSG